MNGPAWPGQPPGPPGYPPGPPPGGPGGFPPPPPPPRKGGGGFLVPVLIFAAVAVLSIVGLGAFVVLQSDDEEEDPPPIAHTSPEPRYSSSTPRTTPSNRPTGGSGDLYQVLKSRVETAKGNTFTRAGTRTDPCTTRANGELKTVLRDHPCSDDMHSAVYADSNKKIVTAVSILDFAGSADAEAVKEATNRDGWPRLLTPSDGSGLRKPDKEPSYWTRTWALDNRVIYAQSYMLDGSSPGGRNDAAYTTAGELGTEITNVLRFTN